MKDNFKKNLFLKFGSNKDLKILSNILSNYSLFFNAKSIKNKAKTLSSFAKHDFVVDVNLYEFLGSESYLEDISKSSKEIVKEIINYDISKSFLEKLTYLLNNCEEIFNSAKNYQEKAMILNKDDADINELIGMPSKFFPKKIIIPYFYIAKTKNSVFLENLEQIIQLNISMIDESLKWKNDDFIAIICLNKNIIKDAEMTKKIIDAYSKYNSIQFIFWIDNFSFKDDDAQLFLSNFLDIINGVGNKNILMHGDYCMSLLNNKMISSNISNVITNLGYGEKRPVFGKGRTPEPYFYLPTSHSRVKYGQLRKIYQIYDVLNPSQEKIIISKYKKSICSCLHCEKMIPKINEININEFITLMTTTKNERNPKSNERYEFFSKLINLHYINTKQKEFEDISQFDKNDYISNLEKYLKAIRLENYISDEMINNENQPLEYKKINGFTEMIKELLN